MRSQEVLGSPWRSPRGVSLANPLEFRDFLDLPLDFIVNSVQLHYEVTTS